MRGEPPPTAPRVRRPASGTGHRPAATGPAIPWRSLWVPLALYAASRLAVWLGHVAAMAAVPGRSYLDIVGSWDSSWYHSIVVDGYSDQPPDGQSNIAFFPLYPVLARALAALPLIGPVDALALVAGAGGVAATVLLWLLTRDLAGEAVATRATALFAFTPGAFVLSLFYSEAIFLAAAIGACWLLIRRRYVTAGVVCALATATRPNGVVLVAVAAVSAAVAIWQRREWRALAAPVLAPLGFLAYLGFTWANTGQADAWFEAQRVGWGEGISLTTRYHDLRTSIDWLTGDFFPPWNQLVGTVGLALVVVGFVALARWKPPVELTVFAAGTCGLAFLSSTIGFRPRFLLVAFPLVMALAGWLRREAAFAVVLALSASAMVALTVITATTLYLTP